MKLQFYLMALVIIFSISCQKESKPQRVDELVTQMQNDPEMKELYIASRTWVRMTSVDISKHQFDSAQTISYLKDLRSNVYQTLVSTAGKVKTRYTFDRYTLEQKKEIISAVFRSYMFKEKMTIEAKGHSALNESEIDSDERKIRPDGKNCYAWLIEEVSDCDEQMVIDTGFALLGLFSGPLSYFISQGAAFVKHSRCVDRAHNNYKKCLASTIYQNPVEIENDGLIKILNPVNQNEFVIIIK